MGLTTESNPGVLAVYKPKPRVRVLEETFNAAEYPVRGNKAKGIRLALREIKSIKFTTKNMKEAESEFS